MRIPRLVLTGLLLFAACDAKTPPDAAKPAGAQTGNKPATPPANTPANVGKAPSADDGLVPVQKPVQTPGAMQGPPRPPNPDMDAGIKELMARPELPVPSISIQHVLISFAGTGTKATRTKDEAKALALKVYAEVVAGADFNEIVRKYTDDSAPGVYTLSNNQNQKDLASRARMVKSFGDVGFRLGVGEIGVAPFDPGASRFGWHIIKRLK